MPNLWPEELARKVQRAPATILKEQAAYLGQQTQNLVTASVRQLNQRTYPFAEFAYAFDVVAPALDFYRYQLFVISHGFDFYPVAIYETDNVTQALLPDKQAETEEDFLNNLTAVFSSVRTRTIINSFYAQSEGFDGHTTD